MTRIRADSGCPTRLSGASGESYEFRQLNGPFRVGGSVWEPLSWNAADNGTQLAPQYIPQVNGPMGIGAVTRNKAEKREVRQFDLEHSSESGDAILIVVSLISSVSWVGECQDDPLGAAEIQTVPKLAARRPDEGDGGQGPPREPRLQVGK